MLDNKILLVTGGTGSFGNKVIEKLIDTNIKEIRIFSRDEKKQDEQRKRYNNSKIKFYIGDIRDYDALLSATKNVDFIFHAAALKQVPSCEFFPMEAVKTNILGTSNLIDAAIHNKIESIVCLSTDKAAYPVNAMGISKAMMEKVFISKSLTLSENSPTKIMGTRYGNVLYSRGSVVPLFIDQIKGGKPITVTDNRMTRFIMTLDEAMDLVIFALESGKNGSLYVQKSSSCFISDLAQAIKELFMVNNEINIIGSRHGEKMYEVLLTREEMIKAIDRGDYFECPADNRDLNYEKYLEKGNNELKDSNDYNSNNTKILNIEEIKEKLLKVPEFVEELEKWKNK